MMRNHTLLTLAFALAIILGLAACQLESITPPPGTRRAGLNIRLTDDPGDYQQVNVDLKLLRVKLIDDSSRASYWYDLATQAGIYDLLQLQNGVDTLVVNDSLPSGELQELRLVLGDSNSVMVDRLRYDLKVPSGSSSGLKVKLNQVLVRDSLSTIVLDFDAGASVVERGNNGYLLRPVIRVVE